MVLALATMPPNLRPARRGGEVSRRQSVIRGTFDAARTTDENRRHWIDADALDAVSAASPAVRSIMRQRVRHEVKNNCYAKGLVLTLANDLVGTGPRLQVNLDSSIATPIERAFGEWMQSVLLAEKLRTMCMALSSDGEAFALLFSNPRYGPVQLDLRLLEADQVADLMPMIGKSNQVDGIVFDDYGNPKEYHVLKSHPGNITSPVMGVDTYAAKDMLHWFRRDRPGQVRGIPHLAPALMLFALLRRYTLAVTMAAESAANMATIMKTTAPAGGEAAECDPMLTMEYERNMLTFAPEGWEPYQLKAEQPTATYEMFKRELINEIARCLNIPYNVAAGNSSTYNYASGRLDDQTYAKAIQVNRSECEAVILDPLFAAWIREAAMLGLVPTQISDLARVPHQWFWNGREHVDPAKEATAQQTRLASHTTTLAIEYARQGRDWETEIKQRAREKQLMDELGLSAPAPAATRPDEPARDDEE